MAFSPDCINAVKPVVYVVERFWEKTPLGLRNFPPEVVETFLDTVRANLALINIGTSKTPRDKWNVPLFTLKTVATIQEVPKLPPGGDVVLGFSHFPDSYYKSRMDPALAPLVFGTLADSMARLAQRFYEAILVKWEKVVADLPSEREKPEAAPDLGISLYYPIDREVNLKAGGKKKVVNRTRLGLIDIGAPIAGALDVWPVNRIGSKLDKLLEANPRLGPAVVAEQGKAAATGPAYLRAVGRGLAYNLLHEFWHAARGSADHFLGKNDHDLIESDPSPMRAGLKLDPRSVAAIQDHYEATWGRDIAEKKVELGSLPDP